MVNMKKINLVVFPYRDAYFYNDYGPAVRDLQFIYELARSTHVASITMVNRPVSIHERLLGRKKNYIDLPLNKVRTINSFSWDLIGPIKGRSWSAKAYNKVAEKTLREYHDNDCINVILDFLPIGKIRVESEGWYYWYDIVDNFTKHNRFTDSQKKLVLEKYNYVLSNYDYLTGVSIEAILQIANNDGFKKNNIKVVSNKVFKPSPIEVRTECSKRNKYDFGFIGFVTDKFDVEIVKKLSKTHTVAIYGKILDGEISKILDNLNNVTVFGAFNYKDIPNILDTFSVGLLPYLKSKSHDGSPLKLYEYIKKNLPCITSIDYEVVHDEYIFNYNRKVLDENEIIRLLNCSGDERISDMINDEWLLSKCIDDILIEIIAL